MLPLREHLDRAERSAMPATLAPLKVRIYEKKFGDVFFVHLSHRLIDEGGLSPGMIYFPIAYPNTAEAQHLGHLGETGKNLTLRLNELGGVFGVVFYEYGLYIRFYEPDSEHHKLHDLEELIGDFFGQEVAAATVEPFRSEVPDARLDQPLV